MTSPDLSHIVEGARVLAVPIGDLVNDPANVRRHSDRNKDTVRDSMLEFGQVDPIVVRTDTGVVIAGNLRLEIARELGWTHIAALRVDMDAITATRYGIADNRLGELGNWDYEALSGVIETLQLEDSGSLDTIGWSEYELGTFMAIDWTPPERDETDTDDEEGDEKESTSVNFTLRQWAELQSVLTLARADNSDLPPEDPATILILLKLSAAK